MKTRKRLYRVTLRWNHNDTSEGDFSELVWAVDRESAIVGLARRMSRIKTGTRAKNRRTFVQNLVDEAGPYCAEDVGAQLPSELGTLLAGPRRALTSKRTKAFEEIIKLLECNGVTICSHTS